MINDDGGGGKTDDDKSRWRQNKKQNECWIK
jgi:hypothetical protein